MNGQEDPPLFNQYTLSDQLLAGQQRMLTEIDSIPADELLNTNPETLADYFEQEYFAAVPTLHEDQIEVAQEEITIPGGVRLPLKFIGTEYSYHVPYEGNGKLFDGRPSTFGNPPRGVVSDSELTFHFRVFPDLPQSASVSGQFDAKLNAVRKNLATMRQDVVGYNGGLRSLAAKRIATRREKLQEDRRQVASLGYPMRRRDSAPASVVPSVRRKPKIQRPSGDTVPFAPEPRLETAEYEHILSIMGTVGRVMELSPSAFKQMPEEALRFHFLVQLNGHYEGQATAEAFNLDGRTDIIIRDKGRNIFIAEFKFWSGPKGLKEAIDQLLGYTSWRDTKTAIVLFNRDRNLSTLLAKIPPAVVEHSNHLRRHDYPSETGFRFVMRHRDDPGRELILTIMVFEVPTEATPLETRAVR